MSKSLGNAPRIVENLGSQDMTPVDARQWIIENAYCNAKDPTPLHSFKAGMHLLSSTVGKPVRIHR
jgi:hypothetical protein